MEEIDLESRKGKFGWASINEFSIPYILRPDGKYCALRILDCMIFKNIPYHIKRELYSCTESQTVFATNEEINLLQDINANHCDFQFGTHPFDSTDLLLNLPQAIELCDFMRNCYTKILKNLEIDFSSRCGFLFINKDSLVPYTVKNNEKYVPTFYFDGDTNSVEKSIIKMEGLELCYLKFCFNIQGIDTELFAGPSCLVMPLETLKKHLGMNTVLEEFWPTTKSQSIDAIPTLRDVFHLHQNILNDNKNDITNNYMENAQNECSSAINENVTNDTNDITNNYMENAQNECSSAINENVTNDTNDITNNYMENAQNECSSAINENVTNDTNDITNNYMENAQNECSSAINENVTNDTNDITNNYMENAQNECSSAINENVTNDTNDIKNNYMEIAQNECSSAINENVTNNTNDIKNNYMKNAQNECSSAINENVTNDTNDLSQARHHFYIGPYYSSPFYFLKKIKIDDRIINCIVNNSNINEKMVTLEDLCREYYLNMPIFMCKQLFNFLNIDIYKANPAQNKILQNTGLYEKNCTLTLIQLEIIVKKWVFVKEVLKRHYKIPLKQEPQI